MLPSDTDHCRRYFEVARLDFSGSSALSVPADRFTHLLVLNGSVAVTGSGETVDCVAGDSVLLPAGVENPTLEGAGTLLLSCPR